MLLNNQEITEEIKGEIKKHLKINDKHDDPKPMGCSKSSSKREVHSNAILTQETRNSQINNLTLHLKGTRERRTNKTQS